MHTFQMRYTAQASKTGMNGKHARGSENLSLPPLQSPVCLQEEFLSWCFNETASYEG